MYISKLREQHQNTDAKLKPVHACYNNVKSEHLSMYASIETFPEFGTSLISIKIFINSSL